MEGAMGSRGGRVALAAFVVFASVGLVAPVWAQPAFDDLVRQSSLIFQGVIVTPGATSMPEVPVSPSTVVVKVNQVFQAPKALTGLAGQEITVLMKGPAGLKRGDQAVFFAQGWMAGEGIAVQEVGRLPGRGGADLPRRVAAARQAMADQELGARVSSAQLVVVGKISGIAPRPPSDPSTGVSEHDPQWQEAILQISTVLKGDRALKEVVVLMPGTLDVAWVTAPRFTPGQEGVWILQRHPELPAYTALDPLDVQPLAQQARIRRLLAAPRSSP
jgi:hypothetical protein